MNLKKKEVLITGGSGYIGSCLAIYLSKNYSVTTLDKINKNYFIKKKINHYKIDLCNKKKLFEIINKIKPQIIIHLAGQSTIDMVEKKKIFIQKIIL